MPEVAITAYAVGGNGLRAPSEIGDAGRWVPAPEIEDFAVRERKATRFLNRGSIVTAAVVEAALKRRWPDPVSRPDGLSLAVGSAFGNEGETARYFARIRECGPEGVLPMESYDVACNSFVSFCSIHFGLRGAVNMVSSGSSSGSDAVGSALGLLESPECAGVVVVGAEHESPLPPSYGGEPTKQGGAESAAVLVLERSDRDVHPVAAIIGAESGFCRPDATRGVETLRSLVERLLGRCNVAQDDLGVVVAGPTWTNARALLEQVLDCPQAAWLDGMPVTEPWQVGATGALGCVRVLGHFAESATDGLGLVVTIDPAGWMSGLLIKVSPRKGARREPEDAICRP